MSSLAEIHNGHSPEQFMSTVPEMSRGMKIDDRFILDRQIGKGGQAIVFGALDSETDTKVALKISKISGERDLGRFEREAIVTEQLSRISPDISPFVAAGVSDQFNRLMPYIATELQEGKSMYAQMRERGGRLSVEKTLAIATPALRGAVVTHDAGLIHRDIKHDNMFVGADGTAKLGDFGIVASDGSEAEKYEAYGISPKVIESKLTFAGMVPCTPENMPPETNKYSIYGKPGDVFTTGITLSWALTGENPKAAATEVRIADGKSAKPFDFTPPELEDLGNIPKQLGVLIISCLDPEPASRPTMHEVVRELENV